MELVVYVMSIGEQNRAILDTRLRRNALFLFEHFAETARSDWCVDPVRFCDSARGLDDVSL